MPNPSQPDLVSASGSAEILGVDVSTIARWAQLGKLPTYMQLPGKTGARLFERSAVERLRDDLARVEPAERAS